MRLLSVALMGVDAESEPDSRRGSRERHGKRPAKSSRIEIGCKGGRVLKVDASIAPETLKVSVSEQYSPIVPFESSLGVAAAGLPGRAPEDRRRVIADTPSDGLKGDVGDQTEGDEILDLHQLGLTVSAISRETGTDRKTVRKYTERGLEAPAYGPRKPRATVIDPFASSCGSGSERKARFSS